MAYTYETTCDPEVKSLMLRNLASGPGKLCQAFAVDRSLNGASLSGQVLYIEDRGEPAPRFKMFRSSKRALSKKSVALAPVPFAESIADEPARICIVLSDDSKSVRNWPASNSTIPKWIMMMPIFFWVA